MAYFEFPDITSEPEGSFKFKITGSRAMSSNKNNYKPSPVIEIYYENELLIG